MDLDTLNGLPVAEAQQAFLECCASNAWAAAMVRHRPFHDEVAVLETARDLSGALGPGDWSEAFAAHPRIGETRIGGGRSESWSRHEQAGTHRAPPEVIERLAACNREYEARFGRVYLVFASGRSAGDLLEECARRLGNDPETERQIAARELEKITELRLRKLMGIG